MFSYDMPEQEDGKRVGLQEVCDALCRYRARGNKPVKGPRDYYHDGVMSWTGIDECKARLVLEKFAE